MPDPTTYLLIWNPKRYFWEDFYDDWEAFHLGFKSSFNWSCGNSQRIHIGDRVYLMRLGLEPKGIFASGIVISEPYQDDNWNDLSERDTALYIDIEFDRMLNPDLQPLLDPKTVSNDFNWFPQRSGVTIPSEIAVDLELAWKNLIANQGIEASSPSTLEFPNNQNFKEGTKTKVFVNRYERNPDARRKCIEHYGPICNVCGFDFELIYGEIGFDYIHVHHLIPLAGQEEEYSVNPIDDLRPVCPNCHAMLHRKTPPFAIEELQSRLLISWQDILNLMYGKEK